MALTPITLIFLGVLALFATLGLFYEFDDPYTGILVGFVSAVLWGFFALGAMDVIVYPAEWEQSGTQMDLLMWVGVGFAILTALFAVNDLLDTLGSEAETTTEERLLR